MSTSRFTADVTLSLSELLESSYDQMIDYLGDQTGGPRAFPDTWTITSRDIIAHTDDSVTIRVVVEDGEADPWKEDPDHPMDDWRYEVGNGDTVLGYWEWRAARLESL